MNSLLADLQSPPARAAISERFFSAHTIAANFTSWEKSARDSTTKPSPCCLRNSNLWFASKALSSIRHEIATSRFYRRNSSPKFPTRNGPATKNCASLFFSVFVTTKARRKSACRSLLHENQTNQIHETS